MRIFFLGARSGDVTRYKNIINYITAEGHTVDASWIKKTADEDAQDFEGSYKRNMESIKACDILVAEVSGVSSGLGFLVASALNNKKLVIALYDKSLSHSPSAMIKASAKKNKHIFFNEYNLNNYKEVLKKALTSVRNSLDTKFILIISPEIDRYLEWASEFRRMHKAQVVRESVEAVMKKDKEYKTYLNSQ